MADVVVQKIDDKNARPLPVFDEIGSRVEEVRRRAFEMFNMRGCQLGYALDDWLRAEHEVLGWPAAELSENDSKYELQVTLPGFDAKEVQVTAIAAVPSEIIIHAQVQPKDKTEDVKTVWTEFGSNNVYRRFELPEAIDVEKTNATLEKGILHLTAMKMRTATGKLSSTDLTRLSLAHGRGVTETR